MQDCMRKVDTKAVMTVRMKWPIFSAGMFLKSFIMINCLFRFLKCPAEIAEIWLRQAYSEGVISFISFLSAGLKFTN